MGRGCLILSELLGCVWVPVSCKGASNVGVDSAKERKLNHPEEITSAFGTMSFVFEGRLLFGTRNLIPAVQNSPSCGENLPCHWIA